MCLKQILLHESLIMVIMFLFASTVHSEGQQVDVILEHKISQNISFKLKTNLLLTKRCLWYVGTTLQYNSNMLRTV